MSVSGILNDFHESILTRFFSFAAKEESFQAFSRHFDEEISIYENITIVNLVERSGNESILGDEYLSHILRLNSPHLTYVTFDFHDAT
jgi:hypothetical protein